MGIGGLERAVFQLVRGQHRDRGLRVGLLTVAQGGFFADRLRADQISCDELGQTNAFDRSVGNRFVSIASQYDIVHFHTQSPWLMWKASRIKRVKLAYTHRGGSQTLGLRRAAMYAVAGHIVRRRFEFISGNTSHAADVVSDLFHIPREQVATTYNGIEFKLLEPSRSREKVLCEDLSDAPPDAVRIATTANLRPWKRIDWLLEALAEYKDGNWVCDVIGDGPSLISLQSLAESLGISNRVHFLGRKQDVCNYLQCCDLFVLPSNPLESFGNSAIEAIALGIPTIVMADGGGMVEHFPPHLRDFPRTVEELSARIRHFVCERRQAAHFAAQCQQYVREKYTVEKMLDAYRNLYCI